MRMCQYLLVITVREALVRFCEKCILAKLYVDNSKLDNVERIHDKRSIEVDSGPIRVSACSLKRKLVPVQPSNGLWNGSLSVCVLDVYHSQKVSVK